MTGKVGSFHNGEEEEEPMKSRIAFPSPSLLNQFGSKIVERLVSRVPTVSRLIKHNIFSPELVLCSRILLNKSCNNHNYRYRMHRIYNSMTLLKWFKCYLKLNGVSLSIPLALFSSWLNLKQEEIDDDKMKFRSICIGSNNLFLPKNSKVIRWSRNGKNLSWRWFYFIRIRKTSHFTYNRRWWMKT